MRECLLDPLSYYEQGGKALHEKNVSEYFDSLERRSGINAEENRATARAYRSKCDEIEKCRKQRGKYTFWSVVCWIFCLLIFTVIIYFKILRPRKKELDSKIESLNTEAKELYIKACTQMEALNSLFSERDTLALIEKTMPEFSFDSYYCGADSDRDVRSYDFAESMADNCSVTATQSGKFLGNPFIFYRYKECVMGTKTYTGSIVITWTETYRDSDGKTHTRHRSQTLTASVVKPMPYYYTRTALDFGSQASPDLSFSRRASHTERLDEKDIARKVKKGKRSLEKKARKAVVKGGNFREMANSDFDVLFGATDRDHEVQFRVMYTPLAQQNTVKTLRNRSGYGDDFSFIKKKRRNTIISEHSQHRVFHTDPSKYRSYDIDIARKNFEDFNNEYFRSVYFDFLPLMSVPAYMEEPVPSMEDIGERLPNYTFYEYETLANGMGQSRFSPDESGTESILKSSFKGKNGKTDRVEVTAYSHAVIQRVEYVSKLGGDGHFHAVPVFWDEYIPIDRTTEVRVKTADDNDDGYRCHGLVCNIED